MSLDWKNRTGTEVLDYSIVEDLGCFLRREAILGVKETLQHMKSFTDIWLNWKNTALTIEWSFLQS